MKTKLLLLLLLVNFSIYAQYTSIPDLNFEKKLIALGIDSGTVDGKVLTNSINTLTSLDVSSSSIVNLMGIQDFVSLKTLNCYNNKLTILDISKNIALTSLICKATLLSTLDLTKNIALESLDISLHTYGTTGGSADGKFTSLDLSKNIALTTLNCDNNPITTLDLSNNIALNTLSCNINKLTSLDLSKNLNLNSLNCRYNQLTSLDVSKNTALTTLNCSNNELTSLNTFNVLVLNTLDCWQNNLTNLDLSDNVALTRLNCFSNLLTSLDLSKNISLTYLDCSSNQLSSFKISSNQNLTYLDCKSNQLIVLDVSENTALTSLYCQSNLLTTLDVSKNVSLTGFTCQYNQLTSLDVSNNKVLTYLVCMSNKLQSLNLKNGNNTLLKYFSIGFMGNPDLSCITVDDAAYSTLNWADAKDPTASYNVDCTPYTLIPDSNFEQKLIDLGIDKDGKNGKVLTSNISALTFLNVNKSSITDLTGIQDFTSLTSLYCGQNQLTALNVSKNTALTTLDCNNNKITNLDVSKNIALTSLSCYTNQLTALDLKINTALTKLDCGSNQITSLDVSANTALTFLGCNTSQLTALDISNNTALNLLDCRENKLTNLDVSKNTALTELYCQSNQLTNLDVSKNKVLEFINCSKNQFTVLDISLNTSLVGLYCNSNQLTSLNLKNGNNVKFAYLNLTNNPNLSCIQVDDAIYFNTNWVTKKDATASYNENCDYYTSIPDSNFEQKLIDLGIDTDGLNGKITIANINSITSLDLSNSNIKDLTGIESFTALNILDCRNNQLTSLDLSKNTNLQILYVTGNPLVYINLKNGNNQNLIVDSITSKKTTNTSGTTFLGITTLSCVKVDSAAYSNANWSKIKETTTSYSETCTLGLEDSEFNKAVVYPNPTKGEVNILNIALEKATIYNALGQLVKTFILDSSNTNNTISLSSLPKGVYYIYLINQDAASAKKVIVE